MLPGRMRYRRFGRLGWQVGEVGCGMWGAVAWSGGDRAEVRAALQRAVDLGCTFFDTALAYGDGDSEALLGELVRANPDRRLYTATKVPPKSQRWPSRRGFTVEDNYPPDHIEACLRRSLASSGLLRFDLLQLHTWEDDWLKDRRWLVKLDELKRAGVIGGIGISINRWEPWNGVEAVRAGVVDAVQVIYNIFDQSPDDQLFPMCAAHDVAVIARVPFDEGSLTGNLTRESRFPADDWRASYFVPENLESSVAHADALRPLVPPGSTMAEMAMRFVLANEAVATVIPGMRRRAHVEANVACSDAGPLPAPLLRELRAHRWDRSPTPWSQ
jgi:aryl-alcohol dehydrogenase-like predicted oxidoreductase